jgi:hypothetical protein
MSRLSQLEALIIAIAVFVHALKSSTLINKSNAVLISRRRYPSSSAVHSNREFLG